MTLASIDTGAYLISQMNCNANRGRRVSVCDVAGVTILLSQTVFSLLVAHVLTRTSEAVPLIGTGSS